MSSPGFARRALEAFAAAGVSKVFGLPGVHNLAFWSESGGDLPEIIGVRHEQTTVYAADSLARATGGLGVALTTTGPGAANAVAAFGEAASCGSPVLLLATEVPSALRREGFPRGALHESPDQAGMFSSFAKQVFRARSSTEASAMLADALALARTPPCGPVYLDMSSDLLVAPAPAVPRVEPGRPTPSPGDVVALAEVLDAAERIVIWAGGGCVASGAAPELRALAEQLSAPVVETFAARGILPLGHPLRVGAPPHEPEIDELIGSAEVLLAVGTRFDAMSTRNWSMTLPPTLAVVNVDPADIWRNFPAHVAVCADAAETLDALAPLVRNLPVWAHDLDQRVAAVRARCRGDERTKRALELLVAIEGSLPTGALVIADMSILGYWVAGYAALEGPRSLQYPVGWGTLGFALPASIASAAHRRPTLVVAGDGALAMGLGEFATLAQHRLPVTVLVVDDGGYGMLRFDQERAAAESRGVDLSGPDFVRLGEAFGIEAIEVAGSGARLRKALSVALESGEPRIVVVKERLFPPRTTSPRWHDPL